VQRLESTLRRTFLRIDFVRPRGSLVDTDDELHVPFEDLRGFKKLVVGSARHESPKEWWDDVLLMLGHVHDRIVSSFVYLDGRWFYWGQVS